VNGPLEELPWSCVFTEQHKDFNYIDESPASRIYMVYAAVGSYETPLF